MLISKDFIKLIITGIIIAIPLAWLATNQWLQTFHYRTGNSAGSFLLAALIILVMAVATIMTLAVKAANRNPAKSLRTE
jgi:putative ABC transport system permease protein